MKQALMVMAVVWLVSGGSPVAAYDPATHREIGLRGSQSPTSSLDEFLKLELGLSAGIREEFPGVSEPGLRRVEQLIGDGAFFEDIPATRSLNHFHNPLVDPWSEAGLRGFSIFGLATLRGQSSVLWQQNPRQDETVVLTPLPLEAGGGHWSWQDARRRYLEALTNPSPVDTATGKGRDIAFGELFEGLGHLIHVVQDATVPAHVRNDTHPPFVRPDFYEKWVEEARRLTLSGDALFTALLTQPSRKPAPSIFTPITDLQAPLPFGRLIDTNTFLRENSDVLSSENLTIGVAEYTNGNFLSRGTRFRGFQLPRPASLDPGPVVELEPGKFRRYFTKNRDGARIEHFATEGMLYQSQLAARGAPLPGSGWMLDDRVHEDYARDLLPRAVGYSAALIDYFFRGKLDADLEEGDAADASIVRVSGTNRSPDPLDGGILRLYAEAEDKTRTAVNAVDGSLTVSAGASEPVRSARFQLGSDPARFVAVYRGKLGNEIPTGDPADSQSFPGGVIGKVIENPRVEKVFSDGTRWQLRTPEGVFPLPILAAEIEDLRWGDLDNRLVGRTRLGVGAASRFKAYRIRRPLGSVLVPRVADAGGLLVVDLEMTADAPFPAGLPLGTSVTFRGTDRVQQAIVTFETRQSLVLDATTGAYVAASALETSEASDAQLEIVVNTIHAVSADFAVTLALDKLNAPGGRPYTWRLAEIGLDAQDRMLALVEVSLTEPDGASGVVNLQRKNPLTGTLEAGREVQFVRASFGFTVLLVALVDVQAQRVLATTAAPNVAITVDNIRPLVTLQRFATGLAMNGPEAGNQISRWVDGAFTGVPSDQPFILTTTFPLEAGVTTFAREGRYRPAIAEKVPTATQIASVASRSNLLYAIVVDSSGVRLFKAFQVDTTSFGPVGYVAELRQGQRPRPGPEGDVLLLFGIPLGDTEGEEGLLLRAGGDTTPVSLVPGELPRATHRLAGTTSERALVVSIEGNSRIVELQTGARFEVAGQDLSNQFVLLDPAKLYHVGDLRFYRLTSPLTRTALPRKLADVPENNVGDYHIVKRP